jgi:hypothetical protein
MRFKWMPLLAAASLTLATSAADAAPAPAHLTQAQARAKAEAMIFGHNSPLADGILAMKTNFPDEYARMIDDMATQLRAGGGAEAATKSVQAYLLKLTYAHMGDIADAPIANLTELTRVHIDLFKALERDEPERCAQSESAGLTPSATDSPAVLRAFGENGPVQIRAERAGIDHPTPRSAPTPADGAQFRAAFTQVAGSLDDLAKLSDPAARAAMTPQARCRVARQIDEALLAMPEESRGRVVAYGYIKFKSMVTQPPTRP